ncbi:HD-GYP domain-containing protein [Bacillus sp. N9]
MLKHHNFSEDIAMMAKYHHEQSNGSGYPEGLKHTQIKTEIKILGIVNRYSSLTLNRPYRQAYGSTIAQKVLINEYKLISNHYFYNFLIC